jgi:hypothetical protein
MIVACKADTVGNREATTDDDEDRHGGFALLNRTKASCVEAISNGHDLFSAQIASF